MQAEMTASVLSQHQAYLCWNVNMKGFGDLVDYVVHCGAASGTFLAFGFLSRQYPSLGGIYS